MLNLKRVQRGMNTPVLNIKACKLNVMSQKGPSSGSGGPPDLDEVLAGLKRGFRRLLALGNGRPGLPSGSGPEMTRVLRIALGVLALFWIASGFYIVDAGNVGMILRFGRLVEITQPGPHWHLPWPVEAQAEGSPLNMAQVRTVEVGYRSNVRSKVPAESLILTDDENIVDVQFAVQFTVKDPQAFLFNNRNPEEAVMQAAETAIREVIGRSKMDFVLYEGRAQIAQDAAVIMQTLLDRYKVGVNISKVNMQNAQPPEQVQAAFDDAVKAGQDRERQKNEGQAYANDVIPRARGAAARLMAEAQGYSQRVVARAEGDASRFKQLQTEYQKAPDVTRQRLYLDMMQQVLSNTSKVVNDQKGQGSLLYLPLDKLLKNDTPAASSESTKAPTADSKPIDKEAPHDIKDTLRSREREGRP
jgi:membrane protease subunit HflK